MEIASLYSQLVTNPAVSVKPEAIEAIALKANTALLVYVRDSWVCGTALVCLCDDVMFNAQPFAVVENVVIDAAVRGQGIGTTLFRSIEAYCHTNVCSKIMLLSAVARADAHRFFESVGYAGSSKRGFVKYRRDFSSPDPLQPWG